MKLFKLLLLFISFSTFGQNTTVVFEHELKYTVDKKQTTWQVSSKYPKLLLVENTTVHKNFLYYNGKLSEYNLDANNGIRYESINFKTDGKGKRVVKVTKSEEKVMVNGLSCTKYNIDSGGRLFEVFIAKKDKINNVDYVNTLTANADDTAIEPGLVVKVTIYSSMYKEYRPFMDFVESSKSDKSIVVNFESLNLKLTQQKERISPITNDIQKNQ